MHYEIADKKRYFPTPTYGSTAADIDLGVVVYKISASSPAAPAVDTYLVMHKHMIESGAQSQIFSAREFRNNQMRAVLVKRHSLKSPKKNQGWRHGLRQATQQRYNDICELEDAQQELDLTQRSAPELRPAWGCIKYRQVNGSKEPTKFMQVMPPFAADLVELVNKLAAHDAAVREQVTRYACADLLGTLAWLKRADLQHGDIRAANVYVSPIANAARNGVPVRFVLGDFGCARRAATPHSRAATPCSDALGLGQLCGHLLWPQADQVQAWSAGSLLQQAQQDYPALYPFLAGLVQLPGAALLSHIQIWQTRLTQSAVRPAAAQRAQALLSSLCEKARDAQQRLAQIDAVVPQLRGQGLF